MFIFYAKAGQGGPAGSNVVLFADQVATVGRSIFNVVVGSIVATFLAVLAWLIGLFWGNPKTDHKRVTDA